MFEQIPNIKGFRDWKTDVVSSILCFVSPVHMHATNPYKMRLCSLQQCPPLV
jgi:hypothetical protein